MVRQSLMKWWFFLYISQVFTGLKRENLDFSFLALGTRGNSNKPQNNHKKKIVTCFCYVCVHILQLFMGSISIDHAQGRYPIACSIIPLMLYHLNGLWRRVHPLFDKVAVCYRWRTWLTHRCSVLQACTTCQQWIQVDKWVTSVFFFHNSLCLPPDVSSIYSRRYRR